MTELTAPRQQQRSEREKKAALRTFLLQQLVFELALPLGGFYGLQAAGMSLWLALTIGGLLAVPWVVYGMVKRRKVEVMPLFTLCLMVVGALMSMVSGSPRVLLIRDSWFFGLVGLWILGTLPTRRPYVMTMSRPVILARAGEEGVDKLGARWAGEPGFRRSVRVLTAIWGTVLTVDAAIRVVLAVTLPVGSVPLVSTLQYLVVLAGLLFFHTRYIDRHGLKI